MSFSSTTELSVSLRLEAGDRAVGRLARVDRRILFEFDPSFLASPLPISPVELPVRAGVHEERTRVFDGLYGVFDDSPGVPHLLAVAAETGVEKRQAERIIEGVREAVARWGEFAREAEVGSASMGRVAERIG